MTFSFSPSKLMEHRLRISGLEAVLVQETSFPHISEIKRAVASDSGHSQYTRRRQSSSLCLS